MIIGIIKETFPGETRVAATPATAGIFTNKGFKLLVEAGAGLAAGFPDVAYQKTGAVICKTAAEILPQTDILLKIKAPASDEIALLRRRSLLIGDLQNLTQPQLKELRDKNICAFALERLPRISRAQPFDILSSQNNLAGYQAVIKSLVLGNRIAPLMITSAGTIPPLKFLIIGVGVAGLQAIATAKRLGGKVFASDPRPEVKEQVISLGAEFLPDFQPLLPQVDVIITAALTTERKAPKIITGKLLKKLSPGTVLIDMASDRGGNIENSLDNRIIRTENVIIYGGSLLAAEVPTTASMLFANNLCNFILQFYSAEQKAFVPDSGDPLITSTCLLKG